MITFGSVIPLNRSLYKTQKLDTAISPQELFARIQDEFEFAFLLESAKGETRLAEYSFIGFDPSLTVSAKDSTLLSRNMRTGEKGRIKVLDPLAELRRIITANPSDGPFRFAGGAVGYVSYDSVRYWERLPRGKVDDLLLPDLEFGIFNDGIVFDHNSGEVYYHHSGESRFDLLSEILRREQFHGSLKSSKPKSLVKKEKFESMVETAKEYVRSGDIFQVVLSKRYDFELEGDLILFYRALSKINPSPYMYFLKFGERRVVGSSPEMLVRVENRRIETFPIAGTRPHSPDVRENAKLTRELLSDPKEKAEHVMLVDLARNDVGRVAKYGTVSVPEFMAVQQFSHVQHIVSQVTGELRQGYDSFDSLKALFPAGTVSGAPKPRAMEIIDELEPVRRGPYAGAVGYFSFNGNADFAITIRTLVGEGRKCSIQTGAGIVAESEPEREWAETEAKGRALLRALELAEGDEG